MSVTAPKGFVAGGLACGVKESGEPDLAIVATANARPATAAGVFTTNLATAAPVLVSREHLRDGRPSAVVLNSGNANAATGEAGRRDARRMCALTGSGLGVEATDVLVCSTGLIGIPLPMAPIEQGIPKLVDALEAGPAGGDAAALAILTTDTVPKEAVATFEVDGLTITVGGMAKGAAMLSPAMATMLAVVTTDAAVESRALHAALDGAVDGSFHELLVDGCTSTNDTVLVLANGAGMPGKPPIGVGGATFHALADALTEVCGSLAGQMAADAEGATKHARVQVRGARTTAEARVGARAVAGSQLVQCSLNGEDPYWGRVLSELGASGAALDPDRVEIAYNGIVVCRDGIAADHDAAALGAAMTEREIVIDCELGLGRGEATVVFTDLSYGYIDENRGHVVTAAELTEAGVKAEILAEALPYIREFAGRTVVVKYGGHAMDDPALADLFAQDVVLMRLVGMNPVVVHGGGPQITELMRRLGKEPEWLDGLRVTDAETVDIARMALVGQVNGRIVASVNRHGSYAVGLSGEDAGLITAEARDERLGFVGDVRRIDPAILHRLLREELIPVVATMGIDAAGQGYNVNADTVAGAVAEALGAEKLVYLTDVAGLYRDFGDPDSLISRTDVEELVALTEAGAFDTGMIPKVSSCIAALRNGVVRAHILDGRVPHALLLEFFTREGIGTMVTA